MIFVLFIILQHTHCVCGCFVAPYSMAIRKSLEHLYILGALTDEGKLSDPLGLQMSRFPVEPLYAKAMILSSEYKCSAEMLALVAMLSVESIFYQPRGKMDEVVS